MATIRKDLMGVEPKVGDFIAYNPPYYKGVEVGIVVGYSPTGLPVILKRGHKLHFDNEVDGGNLPPSQYHRSNHVHIPRTGFAVIKQEQDEQKDIQAT